MHDIINFVQLILFLIIKFQKFHVKIFLSTTGGVEPHTCALYAITAVLLLVAAILGAVLIAYTVKTGGCYHTYMQYVATNTVLSVYDKFEFVKPTKRSCTVSHANAIDCKECKCPDYTKTSYICYVNSP